MLYGEPLNIKLFIFHKVVHQFISMLDLRQEPEVQFIMYDEMCNFLMNLW